MSKKKGTLLPTIIIVIALIAAGFGIWSYQSAGNKETTSKTDSVKSAAEPAEEEKAHSQKAPSESSHDHSEPATETVEEAQNEGNGTQDTAEQVTKVGKELFSNDGTELPTRAVGDPNAPIHMVEYASLTCSHCATFHKNTWPQFKADYVDTGKVYMIFREFPLNKAAIEASQILRCMPEDKHYNFMTLLFETQDQWAFSGDYLDKVKQNAKLAGLSEDEITSCLADDLLAEKLTKGLKVGTDTYGVRSTPSFVINGGERLITGNQQASFFAKVIDDLLAAQETE